ncbi:MAG: cation:proton antiporter [Alphaproteobacteria bacterium]
MDLVFQDLLILMIVVWGSAVVLKRFGIPTIMGELMVGVLVGPAILGWVHPNEIIEVLAQMGIFFLMLHTGVETRPRQFFNAVKMSIGVALVGAIVPFSIATGIGLFYGLSLSAAVFLGLVFTATAVVITLKILNDLGLNKSRLSQVVIASCIIDDLLTLIIFSMILGIIQGGPLDLEVVLITAAKVVLFFGVSLVVGLYVYPKLKHPFRNRHGEGFTFILVLALAAGLFAQAIGLHIILGAYIAGLFFEEKVASKELMQKVEDRLKGIAYSFLGPIFFVSLGFSITFDVVFGPDVWMILALTFAVGIGQIISAGSMARLAGLSKLESLGVGIGMCGRAEMAFILAALGLNLGVFDERVFSIIIFATFLLNLFTPVGLKMVATRLKEEEG